MKPYRCWHRIPLLLALVVTLVQLATITVLPTGPWGPTGLGIAVTLTVGQGIALHRMPRHPERAVTVTALAASLIMVAYPVVGAGAALPALFGLACLRAPRRSLWGLAGVSLLAGIQTWTSGWRDGLIVLCATALSWALGELARLRAQRRRAEAHRVAAAERERIARDLHDVVAHHVAVVVVQATAADDVFDHDPQQARTAIRAIESTGRQALTELRRVVTAMSITAEAPAPGLDEIEELAAAVRAAGYRVAMHRSGETGYVPETVALVGYRIAQEALTNVVRHSSAQRIDISVRYGDEVVDLEVRDDGDCQDPVSAGRGMRDMTQRAAEIGGTVTAGPDENGGFRVRAWLPR